LHDIPSRAQGVTAAAPRRLEGSCPDVTRSGRLLCDFMLIVWNSNFIKQGMKMNTMQLPPTLHEKIHFPPCAQSEILA
ncbi:MAG: hypothetical protein II381_01460, partial [Victivallales bacterium]|nr:hypothetical protein [Victivallales bacterium]